MHVFMCVFPAQVVGVQVQQLQTRALVGSEHRELRTQQRESFSPGSPLRILRPGTGKHPSQMVITLGRRLSYWLEKKHNNKRKETWISMVMCKYFSIYLESSVSLKLQLKLGLYFNKNHYSKMHTRDQIKSLISLISKGNFSLFLKALFKTNKTTLLLIKL